MFESHCYGVLDDDDWVYCDCNSVVNQSHTVIITSQTENEFVKNM